MEARAEEEVDAIPRHPDHRRAEDGAGSQTEVADPPGITAMEDHHVRQQRHQRPDFLGIPSPESPPGDVGPQAAEDRAGCKEDHRHLHRLIDVASEFNAGLGMPRSSPASSGIAAEEIVAQRQDPQAPGESAGGVARDNREDMDREPEIVAEDRLQRTELLAWNREEPGDERSGEGHRGDDESERLPPIDLRHLGSERPAPPGGRHAEERHDGREDHAGEIPHRRGEHRPADEPDNEVVEVGDAPVDVGLRQEIDDRPPARRVRRHRQDPENQRREGDPGEEEQPVDGSPSAGSAMEQGTRRIEGRRLAGDHGADRGGHRRHPPGIAHARGHDRPEKEAEPEECEKERDVDHRLVHVRHRRPAGDRHA